VSERESQMRNEWLLSCRIAKGMFPDEVAVIVSTAEGTQLSLFISGKCVTLGSGHAVSGLSGEGVDGKIPVRLIDRDERFGLVSLPADPIEGSRVAKVSRNLLTEVFA